MAAMVCGHAVSPAVVMTVGDTAAGDTAAGDTAVTGRARVTPSPGSGYGRPTGGLV
ncbi:hypothetical protein Psi02_37690 [Planotetraspora silvatica]|uniref:Uncharacterized protein n=1 Tax=Planotetraspora silvatica TaxID=234614 RepID=A0A8J3XNK9_9ACTN|nr:hypothetical protein Psi02_37690 [Planotetraspora silvatica]